MASKSFCDICQRRDKTSAASKFCSDCEDALCAECLNVHNAIKALASHHVVNIKFATDDSNAVDKHCTKHREMILELYCSDHDTMCCRSCMTSDHRTCEKLLPIEVASKNVKSSSLFQDTLSDIGQLLKTSKQFSDEKNKIKPALVESKRFAQKKVAKFKEALLKRIHEIEKTCLSELDSFYSDLASKSHHIQQDIEMRVQKIREVTDRFEFVANHGSESQIFRLLYSINSDLSKVSKDFEEYIPSLKLQTVDIEETDLLPLIKTLGSVVVKEIPFNINYKRMKSHQAQKLQTRKSVLNRLELETQVTVTEGGYITGMCITTDDRLILCKWISDPCLLVLTNKGKFIQKILLRAAPWGIAIKPSSDEAWCTLPSQSYVQIISTKTYQPIRQVTLSSSRYYGIAFVGDQGALGGTGKVDIINRQGVLTKSLNIGGGIIHSMSAAGTAKMYCCQADSEIFHCINLDGSRIFTYSSKELSGPIGVTYDSCGNLYVMSYFKSNLHKISPSGDFMDIILKEENGLCRPYCLCFSRDYSRIFIQNYNDDKLLIFKCIYT